MRAQGIFQGTALEEKQTLRRVDHSTRGSQSWREGISQRAVSLERANQVINYEEEQEYNGHKLSKPAFSTRKTSFKNFLGTGSF